MVKPGDRQRDETKPTGKWPLAWAFIGLFLLAAGIFVMNAISGG